MVKRETQVVEDVCRRGIGTLETTVDPKLKNHRGSGTTGERGSCVK
jgi:hypothetical protein